MKRLPIAILLLAACDRAPHVDPLLHPGLDASVWREDARQIFGTLPHKVGTFVPIAGADSFATSYASGPAFGASCTYADAGRQLVLRIEAGETLLAAPEGTNAGAGTLRRAVKVHDWPATVQWDGTSRTGEVRFMVARHYVVGLHLVPGANADETVRLAESIDTAPLEALSLEGVTR